MQINPPEYYNDTDAERQYCVCQTCFDEAECEYTHEWQCDDCRKGSDDD